MARREYEKQMAERAHLQGKSLSLETVLRG